MAISEPMLIPRTKPRKPDSVQPGGGWCQRIELLWGCWRRFWLRTFRPGYVRHMAEVRRGECPGCKHKIIDSRDLKYCRNVCGYWFLPKDDAFLWRNMIGLARYGLAEVVLFSILLGTACALFVAGAVCLFEGLWLGVLLLFLVWLEIIYFFRDPQRDVPLDPTALVSPADGTVTNVEEVAEADFPGGRALRISIFLSIFNVHVNRSPRTARVVDVRYFPGSFLDARYPQSAVQNEQLWIDLEEAGGRPLRVKQISGAIARRIVCWLKPGDQLQTGERIGMIKLGSRTDLLIPPGPGVEILVKVGDKVRGGSTVLMKIV